MTKSQRIKNGQDILKAKKDVEKVWVNPHGHCFTEFHYAIASVEKESDLIEVTRNEKAAAGGPDLSPVEKLMKMYKKAELQALCDDWKIEYTADDNKSELAERIAAAAAAAKAAEESESATEEDEGESEPATEEDAEETE